MNDLGGGFGIQVVGVAGTAGQLAEKNENRLVVEAQENVGAINEPATAGTYRLSQYTVLRSEIEVLPGRTP